MARTEILAAYDAAERATGEISRSARAAAWEELGRRLQAYELASAAIVAYENALRLEPSRFSAVYLKGQAERLGGDLRAASRSMRRALELQPAYLPAAILAATTALQLGELEDAARLAEQAVQRAPRSSAAYFVLGQVRSAQERHAAAARAYESALALEPEASALIGLLASELAGAGDLERSRALAGRAGSVRPSLDDPLLREVLELRQDARRFQEEGALAFRAGDFVSAERAFSRALERDPGPALAWLNRGSASFRLGRIDRAAEDFREALRRDSNLAQAHTNLGILEAARGDDAAAAAAYRRALAIDPSLHDAEFNLGNALLRLGRHGEALATYERVLAAEPARVHAALGAAACLVGSGQPERALAVLERALAIAASNEELSLARARLWSVHPELRPSGRSGAREIEAALVAAPESVDRLTTLALARSELGRFVDAADSLRRAIALLKESGAFRPDLEATLRRLESGRKAIDPAIFAPRAARF